MFMWAIAYAVELGMSLVDANSQINGYYELPVIYVLYFWALYACFWFISLICSVGYILDIIK